MNSETKTCQNCKSDFVIDEQDFAFYEKMHVPAPTWCPDCRLVRRMVWRNNRALYKAQCDLCHKSIFTIYKKPEHIFPIYCRDCWWSDAWDPMSYGQAIDWSQPFFKQLGTLMNAIPAANLWQTNNKNADYSNFCLDSSNIYLSYSVVKAEDISYSTNIDDCRVIADCLDMEHSEQCFEVVMGSHSYNCHHSLYIRNCIDSGFLFDCANCKNCFLSTNLRNRQYVFLNEQLSKEEYTSRIREYGGSWSELVKAREQFAEVMRGAVHKYAHISASDGTTGNDLNNCKNVHHAYNGFDMENIKYAVRCIMAKDCMDITNIGRSTQLIYESVSGGARNSSNMKFTVSGMGGFQEVEFLNYCQNCSNCFGCVGLRGKQYCILNKQYSKEEYEALVPKIIEHITALPYRDSIGREYPYGEFLPAELSPFAYNETIAQEHFPLDKATALAQGFRWQDPEERTYTITKQPNELPDLIHEVQDEIVSQVIGCADGGSCNHQCATAFRITEGDLATYRRLSMPLPRLCPNCRHYARLALRNPLKLWHRSCMCDKVSHNHSVKCTNEFETSYSPDRPEVIYCESCYQAEVV